MVLQSTDATFSQSIASVEIFCDCRFGFFLDISTLTLTFKTRGLVGPTRNNNCQWRPCLSTNRNEMSNINRGPSIDASYQVSVQLAKRFQRRRFFRNWPTRNMHCLWRPCLFTDRDKKSNLYRAPSIDDGRQVMTKAHILARWAKKSMLSCSHLLLSSWLSTDYKSSRTDHGPANSFLFNVQTKFRNDSVKKRNESGNQSCDT